MALDLRAPWLAHVNVATSLALFGVGLVCLLTQRQVLKQLIGLNIMLQGGLLNLVDAARSGGDPAAGQALVISALVAETVVVAIILAIVINVYRHYPRGLVDDLDRLRG